MKKLNIILLFVGIGVLASCNSDDENMDPIVPWTLSAPALSSPEDNSSLFLDVNQANEEFSFSWSEASSSEGFNVTYEFVLSSSADVDFETPIYSEPIALTTISFLAQQLDAFLESANVEAGTTAELIWSVKAVSLDKETLAAPRSISVTRFEEIEVEIDELYIIDGGEVVATLAAAGAVYTSEEYVALQEGVNYILNSKPDGTGFTYSAAVGVTSAPGGDNVSGTADLGQGGNLTAERDQMYAITVDLEAASLTWQYYNLKLFHWDEDGQGWDSRNEYVMTYVHPYRFMVTGELQFSFHSKFNSPWDIQFGADLPSELSGTMTNNGGSNFDNIEQSGLYEANIEVAPDYATGTYEFILQ